MDYLQRLSGFSPVIALNVLAARQALTCQEQDLFRKLWTTVISSGAVEQLVTASIAYGMAPLLLHHLSEARLEAPREWLAPLEKSERRTLFLNLRNHTVLLQLGEALSRQGVPLIPIKGIRMAFTLYRVASHRPMEDMDVLVREEDEAVVRAEVTNLGYHQDDLSAQGDVQARVAKEDPVRLHLPPFHKEGHGSMEVHFHILRNFCADRRLTEELWARSIFGADGARLLAPDHELAYLAAHAHHHLFSPDGSQLKLYWLMDVHERVLAWGPSDDDWGRLVTFLDNWGLRRPVLEVLTYLHGVWGTPLPDGLLLSKGNGPSLDEAPLSPEIMGLRVAQGYLADRLAWVGKVRRSYGVWAAVRYVWSFLFPSARYMRDRYRPTGRSGLFLAYLRRGLRIFRLALVGLGRKRGMGPRVR